MPQLYSQLSSRPDPWLIGRTSAGLCTLQTACPLTVTYNGGSPAADTIAAGSAATVYGGGAATFDASADVWVVLTVPASGALGVVKEADLATVTGDWAGLARLVQHALEPYQPQAYLGAGGLGGAPSVTTVALDSSTAAKALSLWNGTSNDAPPATWQTSGFADGGWAAAVLSTGAPVDLFTVGAGVEIWPSATPANTHEQALVRQHFTLGAALITAATLTIEVDDDVLAVYLNGVALATTPTRSNLVLSGAAVAAALRPGAANVLALWVDNHPYVTPNTVAGVAYELTVGAARTGGLPVLGPAEGDLAYYHAGAWTSLPIGTSGQELTVVAGDPAWTDQPADADTSGTVTSVAFAGPTGTTTGGSPITTSGTISLSWASQSASTFLGAPSGSSGAPTFRALVGADIPVDASTIVSSAGTIKGNYQAGSGVSISGNTISATGSGGSVTSVALTVPGIFSVSGSPVTTSGTLAVSLATQSAHTVFAGPASGSAATPTFRALQSSDLPAAAGAGGKIHAHGHFI